MHLDKWDPLSDRPTWRYSQSNQSDIQLLLQIIIDYLYFNIFLIYFEQKRNLLIVLNLIILILSI